MIELEIMNELIYSASQYMDFYFIKNYELIIHDIDEYIEDLNDEYRLYEDDEFYREGISKLWSEAIQAKEQGFTYMYEFYSLIGRNYTNDLEQVFHDGVRGFKGISCPLTEYLSVYVESNDDLDYSDIKDLAIKKYREREGK